MKNKSMGLLLSVGAGVLCLAMLIAWTVFPEHPWATAFLGALLVADLGALIAQNRAALKGRTAAYGLNSFVTALLVIGIVGVLNFMGSRYPFKLDLTKNKTHTLSDQSVKLIKGLNKTVKATMYVKLPQREQYRPLLENYKALNPKFEVEFVDPDREPTRAKQAGIKKYGTLLLTVGPRDTKVEDVNEEKVTNALIKLLKDKSPLFCSVTGHGEKSLSATDAEGYDAIKKSLTSQAYETKDLNLVQEGKIPENCDVVTVLGPTKAFFPNEVKLLQDYLNNGGRAMIAVDLNIKGGEYNPELNTVLESWHVRPVTGMIVDPLSRMLGVDASVPIVATWSKESPITKDFQTNAYFPFARPLEAIPNAPAGMSVQWLGQTTPKSWSVGDVSVLSKGEVQFKEGRDKQGPLTVAYAVEGKQKDSKATRNTRLVVFGSSFFATNNYSRFGGNLDFFMNSASWLTEDESLISIRAKEDGPGKVELSQKGGIVIFWVTVILVPLATAVAGIVIWAIRRRL